jgi:hypothetical protein
MRLTAPLQGRISDAFESDGADCRMIAHRYC